MFTVKTLRTALAASFLTLTFGAATVLPTVPAEAGSVSIKISPKGKNAKKLQKGLQILSLIQNAKNLAKVQQNGSGNAVGLAQSGGGNAVGVFQDGDGHTAVANQSGGNNALGIIQLGKNTHTDVSQNGGETGLIIQGGW
jgi:hypothetical protein